VKKSHLYGWLVLALFLSSLALIVITAIWRPDLATSSGIALASFSAIFMAVGVFCLIHALHWQDQEESFIKSTGFSIPPPKEPGDRAVYIRLLFAKLSAEMKSLQGDRELVSQSLNLGSDAILYNTRLDRFQDILIFCKKQGLPVNPILQRLDSLQLKFPVEASQLESV